MSTPPPLTPQPEPLPVAALFPPGPQPPAAPVAQAEVAGVPAGGARKLSRWEQREAEWFPEERDLRHSGINE